MRVISTIIGCLVSLAGFSQKFSYCDYFKLDVHHYVMEGDTSLSWSPGIISNGENEFSRFLKDHSQRFEYLLFRKMFEIEDINFLYPDTQKINERFCKLVTTDSLLIQKFGYLTPKSTAAWPIHQDSFSIEELLLVASRFFDCNQVDEKDTSIIRHICIGINGQSEFGSKRDLLLLEAFAFEAIFHYLLKRKPPQFELNFDHCVKYASRKYKSGFRDFDSYLVNVREECYETMKNDIHLKKDLLKYYKRNRNNLNFIIW